MKIGLEKEQKIVEFEGAVVEPPEVFGKLKREADPSIKSLLTWNVPETNAKTSPKSRKYFFGVSESHDAFKCYTLLTNLKRPTSAFEPKPIPDNPEEQPEEPKSRSKSPSSSPKPVSSKTPKSATIGSKRQMERIKKLHQTTRWLPNSAFKTYFGKPIFANYGQGNVNPAYGGLMYGDYMKTHNIAPHEGSNNPNTQQVYELAESKALKKLAKPQILPRKCKDEDRLPPEEVEKLKKRSQVLAKERAQPSKPIVKPNLAEEKIFKSEHNSPNQSDNEAPKKSVTKTSGKPKQTKKISDIPKSAKENSTASKHKPKISDSRPAEEANLIELESANPPELPAEASKTDEVRSNNVEIQVEDCAECVTRNFGRLLKTSYQEMTSGVTIDKKNQIIEPYKYCARCRDCLYPDDVMRPPYSLGEIPPQELDPKNYKTLPPQWTQRIPAAGKLSYRSPSAYTVIFGDNLPIGGYS